MGIWIKDMGFKRLFVLHALNQFKYFRKIQFFYLRQIGVILIKGNQLLFFSDPNNTDNFVVQHNAPTVEFYDHLYYIIKTLTFAP